MKTYSINDIIPGLKHGSDYYVGRFEDTEDPDIECNHRHTYCSIVWFTQGNGINVIDFDEYEILPNRCFTIGPGMVHNWSYSVDCCGYFIMLEEHLAEQLNISFNSPFVDIHSSEKGFIVEVFRRMLIPGSSPEGKYQKDTISISYLCSLIKCNSISEININPKLTGFKKLITRNYEANYTMEQCAEELNISVDELNLICREGTGLSPKQLQLNLKVTEIKRLLLYTSLNTAEVAYRTGFEDPSYFSRIFKKKTGLSPKLFREKYLIHRQKS